MTAGILHFDQFGVTAEDLRAVLATALARGADDADLYFEHAGSTAVALSDGKVNRASTHVDLGVGVRVVVGDQVGYAYTEDLSRDAMIRAAQLAAEIAAGTGSRQPLAASPTRYADRYPVQMPWEQVELEKRVAMVRDWEKRVFAKDARIQKVEVSLADSFRHVLVVRPDGRMVYDYQPMTRGFVTCTAQDANGRRETANANLAQRMGLEFYTPERVERMLQRAVDDTVVLFEAVKPPAGEMTVVLGAGSSGILLHEAIGHGLEADFNRKGVSIYADRLDTPIAPKGVTVVDDGTIPWARGTINADDEGNPAEKTVLIEDGVLRSYLHDEISARHYGVRPTGSGRRESFRHPVLPRMRATYMEAGGYAPEEIIASVQNGIYCGSFANGQVQIGAGDFAFYVRHGYLIENGKLTRPIKDVNLVGNGPRVLETIEMVGNDLVIDEGGWTCGKDGQSVPVSQGMPTVKVSRLSVGGGKLMDTLDLARDILRRATALGAQEATVVVGRDTEVSLMRRAGKLEQASQASSLSASLSLLVDDRYSSHSTSDLRPAALDAFLARAVAATRVLEPEPERRQAPIEQCGRYTPESVLDRFDASWEALSAEARRTHAERLEAAVDALPERARILSATAYVGDSFGESARVMSNGFEGTTRGTGFGHGVEMTLSDEGGRRPEAMAYYMAPHQETLPSVEAVAAEAWQRAAERLGSGPAPSGRYPMLLQNHAVGRILGVLGGPLSGSELHQGRSFLAGKKGTAIASSKLSILDDPTITRGLGSRAWDGDGRYAKPFPVIRDGVLENYYVGTYYGRKLGMEPTTGGRSNWVVPAGARSKDAILRDLERCIVVTGFLGGNSNSLTGDFSFGVQGLLVERGEVTKHLSEMNVSGNIGEVLMNLAEAADDVWTWSGVRSASLLFEGVAFSGS